MIRPAPLAGLAICCWLLAVLILGSGYEQRLMALAAAYALMAIGYQLVFGQAGALSLAQGACYAIGAYAAGILSRLGWPLWAEVPAAVLVPAALAGLAHAPVRRLDGHFFALATLGFAVLVRLVAVDAQGLTGGANGLAGIATFGRGPGAMLVGWSVAGLGAVLALWLKRGGNGPALALVRADAALARTSGLDPERIRARGFVFAAGFAGVGGALQAHVLGLVSPDVAEFSVMVGCLAMVVIGGRGSVAGAVLGALLIGHLPEWLRPLGSSYRIAYGLGLFACLLVAPAGLIGSLERIWPQRRNADATAPLPAAPTGAALWIEDVGKSYGGIAVLRGVTLEIRPGEIVGLIGPNGSGKTTLVNLISGFDRPDAGHDPVGRAPARPLAARSDRAGRRRPQLSISGAARGDDAARSGHGRVGGQDGMRRLRAGRRCRAAASAGDRPAATRALGRHRPRPGARSRHLAARRAGGRAGCGRAGPARPAAARPGGRRARAAGGRA